MSTPKPTCLSNYLIPLHRDFCLASVFLLLLLFGGGTGFRSNCRSALLPRRLRHYLDGNVRCSRCKAVDRSCLLVRWVLISRNNHDQTAIGNRGDSVCLRRAHWLLRSASALLFVRDFGRPPRRSHSCTAVAPAPDSTPLHSHRLGKPCAAHCRHESK